MTDETITPDRLRLTGMADVAARLAAERGAA